MECTRGVLAHLREQPFRHPLHLLLALALARGRRCGFLLYDTFFEGVDLPVTVSQPAQYTECPLKTPILIHKTQTLDTR